MPLPSLHISIRRKKEDSNQRLKRFQRRWLDRWSRLRARLGGSKPGHPIQIWTRATLKPDGGHPLLCALGSPMQKPEGRITGCKEGTSYRCNGAALLDCTAGGQIAAEEELVDGNSGPEHFAEYSTSPNRPRHHQSARVSPTTLHSLTSRRRGRSLSLERSIFWIIQIGTFSLAMPLLLIWEALALCGFLILFIVDAMSTLGRRQTWEQVARGIARRLAGGDWIGMLTGACTSAARSYGSRLARRAG